MSRLRYIGNTSEVLAQAAVDAREKYHNDGANKLLRQLSESFWVTEKS